MAVDQDTRPGSPPPQAVMGLLNYITATSLDEDYAHVSQRRGGPNTPRKASPGRVGLVVLALFGTLVATAAVQTSRNADEAARSRESLIQQINARRDTLDEQRAEVASLTRSVEALRAAGLDATNQARGLRARLGRLRVVAGDVETRGPGIRIVVDDAPGATADNQRVLDQDLQRLVNALWLVGAEAVAVDGQRITNLTAIRQGGEAITVNFVSLRRPYTVSAIGNRNQMAARLLDTDGGRIWQTLRANFGLRFDVETEESMSLPPAKHPNLRYARTPERLR